jgi:hypothetical protein
MEHYDIERVARQKIAERIAPSRPVPRQRRRTTLADRIRRANDRLEN